MDRRGNKNRAARRRRPAKPFHYKPVFELLEDRRMLAAIAWDGGGDANSWSDPLNWDNDTLPGTIDDVTIDVPGDITVVIDATSSDVSIRSLNVSETLRQTSRMLTIAEASTISGALDIESATISGSGDLTLSGFTTLDRASFEGTGTLVIDASATANNFDRLTLRRPTNILGTLNHQEGFLSLGSTLTILPGGNLNVIGDADISANSSSPVVIDNRGTLTKLGAGETSFGFNVALQNSGTVTIQDGELFVSGGSSTTPIDVPAGTLLRFNNDDFTFTSATALTGAGTIDFNFGTHDFSSSLLLPTGTVNFNGGTVTVGNTLPAGVTLGRISGTVNFDADQGLDSIDVRTRIGGSGDLTLTGTSLFFGHLGGTGTVTVVEDATLMTFNSIQISRPVENFGTFRHRGSQISLGDTLTNHPGGELTIEGGGKFFGSGSSDVLIDNRGTLTKSGAGQGEISFGVRLENTGTILLTEGELFVSGGSSTSPINVPADTLLRFNNDDFTFTSATAITGAGTIDFSFGTHDFSSSLLLPTGTVNFSRGTITVGNTLPAGVALGPIGATVVFDADQLFDSISVTGTIGGSGDVTVTGSASLNRARLEGTGTFIVAEEATLSTFNSNTITRPLENFGTFRHRGFQVALGPSLVNHPGAELTIEADGNINSSGASNVLIDNQGMLSKLGPGESILSTGIELENSGILRVEAGELNLIEGVIPGTGRIEVESGARLRTSELLLLAGGSLSGVGTIDGDVINEGTVQPGSPLGTLTINGDFTQESPGRLEIELAGTSTETSDQLNVTGTATLGGTLALIDSGLITGTFDLITSGGINDDFTLVELPSLPGFFLTTEIISAATYQFRALNNEAPFAGDDFITTAEDTTSDLVDLLLNDSDPTGDSLSVDLDVFRSATDFLVTSFGILRVNDPINFPGQVVFTPFENAAGTETVPYHVVDSFGLFAPANITITVTPVNDPPVAFDDVLATIQDTILDFPITDLTDNDQDLDNLALTIGSFTQPGSGTLLDLGNGLFRYEPNIDFVGVDQFTYIATDGDLSSNPAIVRISVASSTAPDPEVVRQAFNSGVSEQRDDFGDYADGFDQPVGGLPLVDDDAAPLDELFDLRSEIMQLGQSILNTAEQAVQTFAELQSQLESLGLTVEQIATDGIPTGDDLLRVRLISTPIDVSAMLSIDDLADTPLAAIADQASITGELSLAGKLDIDFGFGVDFTGAFFVTADSSVVLDLDLGATVSGDVGSFGIELAADLALAPQLNLDSLDTDSNRRLSVAEISSGLANLPLDLGAVTGKLRFDAFLNFLDYVDVDPNRPNNPHGGDPFIVRGTSSLLAQPSEFDNTNFAGVDSQWSNLRANNPDINSDGLLDYSNAVFLKNVLLAGQDLVTGTGALDYFSDVLGIQNATSADVPLSPANEIPNGNLPDQFVPLPDEQVAIDAIDAELRSLIILEEGPLPVPTLAQLRVLQKEQLRDWFLAEAEDDVTKEEEQSVQFRLAKIAPVLGPSIIAGELIVLLPPNLPDTDFDRFLTEAITDLVRWKARVAELGFTTNEIFNLPPDSTVPPLAEATDEVIEGILIAIDRAIARAELTIDAGGSNDVDAMLEHSATALGWSATAAFLGLSDLERPGPGGFDLLEPLRTGAVVQRLPFVAAIDSALLTGTVDDATLVVQAGLAVKNPAGGFFPTMAHELIEVIVEPAIEIEGRAALEGGGFLNDFTQPTIGNSRGPIDATGRFATSVSIGAADTDIVLNVRASLGGVGLAADQQVRLEGPISLDLQGFLPIVDIAGDSLRDGPISVPIGHDVQLIATLRRGNGMIRERKVNFFLLGAGSLESSVVETNSDGTAFVGYTPPAGTGDTAFATVGVAYFDKGQLIQDTIRIDYAPASLIAEKLASIAPSDFSQLPPSAQEGAYSNSLQVLQASQEESVIFQDLTDQQKDGLLPLLETWLDQAVIPNLELGLADDVALARGLRDFLGWRAQAQLLGIDETSIVPPSNPTNDFNQASGLATNGLIAAIARDRAGLLDASGNLLPTATSLAPLYDALQHSLDAELLGIDTVEQGFAFADIVSNFGISIDFTQIELTGPTNKALLNASVQLRIGGEIPPAAFEADVLITAVGKGFSTVSTNQARVTTQGDFTTSAAIGKGDSQLEVEVSAGIVGFNLASERVSLAGDVRIELAAFIEDSAEAIPGPITARAGDIVGIQIDSFRGNAFLKNVDLKVTVTGAGILEQTTVNTGLVGGNIIDYIPPLSKTGGTAIITVSFVNGQQSLVSEQILISYEASDQFSNAVTLDGVLAREKGKLLPEISDPNDLKAALAPILIEWFRGDPNRPEVGSVQSRLDQVQPGAANSPTDEGFRTAFNQALGNFLDWKSQVITASFSSEEEVLATDPLPDKTPAQEIAAAEAKIAPAIREAIVRQDRIVDKSGFDFAVMRAAASEVLNLLATATQLGIDTGATGLDIDETLRNSLAFPTPDQELAAIEIGTEEANSTNILVKDNNGNPLLTPDGNVQFDPAFVGQVQPILNRWFLEEGDDGSVVSLFEDLQPGSPESPADFDIYSNRLKKALRNWLNWREQVGQIGLTGDEVLGSQASEFARSEGLITTALVDAIRRIGIRSQQDVAALPANPTQPDLRVVLERGAEAIDWYGIAQLLGLDTAGSGLSESEVVEALAFDVNLVSEGTLILTRTETGSNQNLLQTQAEIRIDGLATPFFTDDVSIRVSPQGRNSAGVTFGPVRASNGLFETPISLGPGEGVFRYTVEAEIFGLQFDQREIARRAPVDIDLIGAVESAGSGALSNTVSQVVDGKRVRLQVSLRQGNAKLQDSIVYLNPIGPGNLTLQNVRTNSRGRATLFFTPPADQIGKTRIVATYFVAGVANQDILEINFTSTAVDATLVPEISAEQLATEVALGAILNQAGLEALQGNNVGDLNAALIGPIRTWYQTGVRPRLLDAVGELAKLDEVLIEYFNWSVLTGQLGIDNTNITNNLSPEQIEGRALLEAVFEVSIDAKILLALNAGNQPDGNEAIGAIKLGQRAEEALVIERNDPMYGVAAIVQRLNFKVVIEDTDIEGDFGDDSTLELVVNAHVEVNDQIAGFQGGLPIRLNPLGRNTVGHKTGDIGSGEFRTPIHLGSNDRNLRVQVTVGDFPFSTRRLAELVAPVDFVVIAHRSGQTADSASGPLMLGTGQTVSLDNFLRQGNGPLDQRTMEYQLSGEGELSSSSSQSDADGRASITFTPPSAGSGTTTLRAFVQANGEVLTREFTVDWDNNRAPVQGQGGPATPEAAGLLNSSAVTAANDALSLPGTNNALGNVLGLGKAAFDYSLDELDRLIANNQDIDQFRLPHIELLEIVDFQTLVGFFEQGLPDNPAELIRIELSLDDQTPAASEETLGADFAKILPDGMGATISIDQPQFSGQIVIGFDTSSNPFYVLTQSDEISRATSSIDVTFGLNGTLSSTEPLLGTPADPILTVEAGSLNLESTLAIDFSRVAVDPTLGGKLRLNSFGELASTRVGFAGDPLDSFQAIVAAELSIPGLKESSAADENAPNAVIPLVGSVNKPGEGDPFTFELRNGSFPELPANLLSELSTRVPVGDDPREANDSADQVAQTGVSTDLVPTANLGVLNQATTITGLSLLDKADWFRFETTQTGTSLDFVRVDFDRLRGDLDLVLYQKDGDDLVPRARDNRSVGNFAQISLLGLAAGEYFVEVRDDGGSRNPAYVLRINPPGADSETINLGFGIVDLIDASFVASVDTNGTFFGNLMGDIVSGTGTLSDGSPLTTQFTATVDNNSFRAQATMDFGNESITIGSNPALLELSGFLGTVDVQIDLDTGVITGGLEIAAQDAIFLPTLGSTHTASITGRPDDTSTPNVDESIPGVQGSIDFGTGAIDLDLFRFDLTLGDFLEINATPIETGDPSNPDPAVRLTFDPAASASDPLLQFGLLQASIPALDLFDNVTVAGFGFGHDFIPFVSSINVQAGSLQEKIGLAEILPFEVTDLEITNIDFSNGFDADLRAIGTFDPITLPNAQGFQPFVLVGDLPRDTGDNITVDSITALLNDVPGDVSKLTSSTPFDFAVSISNSTLQPKSIPLLTLGFEGLDLGVVDVAGFISLGGYDLTGGFQQESQFAGGIDVTSTVEGFDASLGITLDGTGPGQGFDPAAGTIIADAVVNFDFSTPAALQGFHLDIQNAAALFDLRASIDQDLNFSFDALDLIQLSVDRLTASFGGTVVDGSVPDALLELSTSDVTLDVSENAPHLLTFGSVTASLPGAPAPISGLSGTVSNFAIDVLNKGTPNERIGVEALDNFGVSFAIPPDFLTSLGIPDIIEVTEFGFEAGDDFNDPINPNFADFKISVSGGLSLDVPGGLPFSVDIVGATIDVGVLATGNLLNALDFESFTAAFGTNENPIGFGGASFHGMITIENFDPSTPEHLNEDKSLIVSIAGGAKLADIGFDGQLLITEYGPAGAALSASFGEIGIPLGPVTLFEAGALVLFNHTPQPLPENPIRLIDPEPGDAFDLTPLFDGVALTAAMQENARDLILLNRDRQAAGDEPLLSWETPFLFAIDATLGATGVPRSALDLSVTIGANLSFDPANPAIILFGLGRAQFASANIDVGAVLDLTDPSNFTFQMAFAAPSLGAPSSGGGLFGDIPASIKLGLTFKADDNETPADDSDDFVQLDVFGELTVLDALQAEAAGSLVLNDDGLFGGVKIVIGGGDPENPNLDLRHLGVDVQLAGQFDLLFNLTDEDQTFDRDGEIFEIVALTTNIQVVGTLKASGFEIEGAFLLESDPEGLLVAASGQILLGSFGSLEGEGALHLIREERNTSGGLLQEGGAAGTFEIRADIGIPGIVDLDGRAYFQFNTFADRDFDFEIPTFAGPPILVRVERGPFFMIEITGANPEDLATLSLFPKLTPTAPRPLGIDFTGRFELTARQDLLELSFEADVDVVVFDVSTIGATIGADLTMNGDVIFGTFDGSINFGDTPLLEINAELDRFGCLQTNLGNYGSCDPVVFVPDQRFSEGAGNRNIVVELSQPAISDLDVEVQFVDGTARRGDEYQVISTTTTIRIDRGKTVGRVPVTIRDDDQVELIDGQVIDTRQFQLTILDATYADGGPADPSIKNIEGQIVIVEDDIPPFGPPVMVTLSPPKPGESLLTFDGPVAPGQPLLATVPENSVALFQVIAPGLQGVDSLTLGYSLVPTGPSLTTATVGDDFVLPASLSGTLEIRGQEPALLRIPLVDDQIAELAETFTLQLDIVIPANFAPSTTIGVNEVVVTITNDDDERPTDTLAFYSFDGNFNLVNGYSFTDEPTFTDDQIIASSLRHSNSTSLASDGLPKLDPLDLPDDVTPAAGSALWAPVDKESTKLLSTPGNEESSLASWRPEAGLWRSRISTDPAPFAGNDLFAAGRLESGSADRTNMLIQEVDLGNFASRIDAGQQPFRLAGKIFSADTSTGELQVEYRNNLGDILGTTVSGSVQASLDWVEVDATGIVPVGTRQAIVRLVAESPSSGSLVKVYFDDLSFDFSSPGFFEFDITLDDIERSLDTLLDYLTTPAMLVSALDFWDVAAADGPQAWELRSSLDGFQTVLASGATHQGQFGHHVRIPIDGLENLRPLGSDKLTFRLYGVGAAGGDWQVENVALVGEVRTLSEFPQPPVANDDVKTLLNSGLMTTTVSALFNDNGNGPDFDPNSDPISVTDFSQPSHGEVTHFEGRFTYQLTDLGFTGEDTFTYTITDEKDGIDTATVTIGVLDSPEAVDDQYTVVAGTTFTATESNGLLGNDTFGDFAKPSAIEPVGNDSENLEGLVLHEDGTFSYTPPAGVEEATFRYRFSFVAGGVGSNTATVRLTVVPDANRRAVDDTYSIDEDGTLIVSQQSGVLTNDFQGFGVPLRAEPFNGPTEGDLNLNSDGSFTFTPPKNFNGISRFSYRVGTLLSDPIATVAITVNAVNDRPNAFSRTIEIPFGSKKPLTINLQGKDLETVDGDLRTFPRSSPDHGFINFIDPDNRTVEFVPPSSGFVEETKFRFAIFDRGDPSGNFSNELESTLATITLVPKISTSGEPFLPPTKGTGFNSFVEAADLFLDLNGNRVADSVVIDGAEIAEPVVRTAADGSFTLFMPTAVDRNQNGQVDSDEGRLVLSGGTVAATKLPLALNLVATGDATVVTPFSTLQVALIDRHGLSDSQAAEEIIAHFALPKFDPKHDRTLDRVLAESPGAQGIYRRSVQLVNTSVLITEYMSARHGLEREAVGRQVFRAFAAELVQLPGIKLLIDPVLVDRILVRTAFQLGLPDEAIERIALTTVIVAANKRLDDIEPSAPDAFLSSIARVEQVSHDETRADVQAMATGQISPSDLVSQNTGTALDAQIAAATLGNVRIPQIRLTDAIVVDDATATPPQARFQITLAQASAIPVTLDYTTRDGTLGPSDYDAVAGSLKFDPGETLLLVDVDVNPLATIDGGTFQLVLSNATGAVFDDFIADALVIPSGDDGDAVPATVELLAPNEGDGNVDGILDMRQPHVVSLASGTSAEYVTIIAPVGTTFTAAATRPELLEVTSLPSDVSTPLGQLEFMLSPVATSVDVTIDFQFGIDINSWYQFGLPSGAAEQGWFELLAGSEAELIDTGSEGLVERVVLHLTDGGPGDLDGVTDGSITVRAAAAIDSPWPRVLATQVQEGLTQRSYVDRIAIDFDQPVNLGPLIDNAGITAAISLTNLGVHADQDPDIPVLVTPDQFRYVQDATGISQLMWSLDPLAGAVDSLPDGFYSLVIDAGSVVNLSAQALDGNGDTIPGDSFVLQFHRLAGDANGDLKVNAFDMELVNSALGSRPGLDNWNPNADLDRDGNVTVRDRLLVARAEGRQIILPANPDAIVPSLPGDFNNDSRVDAADYTVWSENFGVRNATEPVEGDADMDLDVDGFDFLTWQRNLGAAASSKVIVPNTGLSGWKDNFGVRADSGPIVGDVDRDNDVDGADFLAWQRNFVSTAEAEAVSSSISALSTSPEDPAFHLLASEANENDILKVARHLAFEEVEQQEGDQFRFGKRHGYFNNQKTNTRHDRPVESFASNLQFQHGVEEYAYGILTELDELEIFHATAEGSEDDNFDAVFDAVFSSEELTTDVFA